MIESNLESLKVAVEAFKRAREVERECLEKNGLQACVVHLNISYNPNGNDHFCLYNNNEEKIERCTGEECRVTFKNEGESQIEIFSRRVKILFMKDVIQVTKITFCDGDGKYVTLQDKNSVEEWNSYENTEYIFFS